jgi:hypothetical protein
MELTLRLTPSQVEPVRRWIATFCRKEKYWSKYPSIKDRTLYVHALCFPFLLAYADLADSNELDLHRLRTLGRREIERSLISESCAATRRSYRHALDNLEYIRVGEFLEVNHVPSVR